MTNPTEFIIGTYEGTSQKFIFVSQGSDCVDVDVTDFELEQIQMAIESVLEGITKEEKIRLLNP